MPDCVTGEATEADDWGKEDPIQSCGLIRCSDYQYDQWDYFFHFLLLLMAEINFFIF